MTHWFLKTTTAVFGVGMSFRSVSFTLRTPIQIKSGTQVPMCDRDHGTATVEDGEGFTLDVVLVGDRRWRMEHGEWSMER